MNIIISIIIMQGCPNFPVHLVRCSSHDGDRRGHGSRSQDFAAVSLVPGSTLGLKPFLPHEDAMP